MNFSLSDIVIFLLLAARWTVVLSALAFAGGGIGAMCLIGLRYRYPIYGRMAVTWFTGLFQSTPLLLQLFIVFFGLPLLKIDVSPWLAAGFGLSVYASAYLADIWRGGIDAIPLGQWNAGSSLGMHFILLMRKIILPQALRITIPPTVGFLVQLLKATALASIVGFDELLRAAQVLTNATFQPFQIYGIAALIYFAMCFPLTLGSRYLESRLSLSALYART